MKIQVCVSNGLIGDHKSGWMDTEELGYTAEEWKALDEDEKYKAISNYAWDSMNLEIYHEESETGDEED